MARNAAVNFPRLASQGLRIVQTEADGNCLFRSLSDQLYGTPDRHLEVREKVVNYMRQYPAEYKGFVSAEVGGGYRRAAKRKATGPSSCSMPSENDHDNEWNRYLNEMAKPKTWGDQLEINAFTKSYDIDVRVYQSDWDFMVNAIDNPNSAPRPCLHIAYHGKLHNHYSSLRNINGPNTDIPKTQPNDLKSYKERLATYESSSDTSTSRESTPTFSTTSSTSSGRSSVKRALDSDDEEEEDIRGPNKRQNRRIQEERKLKLEASPTSAPTKPTINHKRPIKAPKKPLSPSSAPAKPLSPPMPSTKSSTPKWPLLKASKKSKPIAH